MNLLGERVQNTWIPWETLDNDTPDLEVSYGDVSLREHTTLHTSISTFPISNQPVMDTLHKDMLLSLQNSLHADFTAMTQKVFS